ncbi:MAG: aminotransferase [Enterovirga sp.]|nr:aminotransferase [Enterovirga sp.]
MRGINPAVAAVASPPIPEARSWAARYDGALGPVVDLTQAVPGYPAHPDMVRKLVEAAGDPESFAYGHITGDLALREAYAADLSSLYGGAIRPDDVAITAGANLASFAATMLLARPGDAIMLPVPWYFNHQMNAGLLGVDVVPLPCRPETGFVPDPLEAERLLDGRVRAIMLVSPNNPTGAVYPPDVIEAFGELCRRRGVILILDETYRDFRPAAVDRPHGLFGDAGWRDHVIQLYSFSKSYCVPGYRAGAMVAGPRFGPDITKILDCIQICAGRAGQAALAWAIPALRDWREGNRALMNGRGEAADRAFSQLPGWRLDSRGAYFAYLRHPFPGRSSFAVAEALAVRCGVVTLPGSAFGPGQQDHLRLAFANVESDSIVATAARLQQLSF